VSAFRALFGALVAAQVAYAYVPERRKAAATRGIVGLMTATSLAEAQGARRPVVAAGAVGYGAELLGVATGRPFGHYTYSDKLGPKVGGVPLLAGCAWAMMSRPAWAVAGRLSRRRALRVPLAAGALTAWDAFLDPRMARDGYWTWPQGGRYEGIPASNFLGWFAIGLLVFAAWPGDEPSEGAFALYLWTWLGETFANAVIWRRPVTAAVGGAAMGAFAVPACVSR